MKKTLFALLFLCTFSAESAWTQNIRRHPRPIPNQYIVVIASTDDAEAVGLQTQALYGGRIKDVYRKALNGFSIRLTPAAAAALARDPRVRYVEEDGVVQVSNVQANPPWGLDRIDQHNLPLDLSYTYSPFQTQVYVHVIDTGVRTTHVEFGGRAFNAGDYVDDDNNPNTPAANDDADPSTPDGADCYGHGTHVAGIIAGSTYGVAKNAIILSHRVLDCTGHGADSGVIAAIDAVAADPRRPAVANMSLGGPPDSALDDAVRHAITAGVTFVVAAGNSGADASTDSPARVAEAITVGATGDPNGSNDVRPSWSNFGPLLDIFAPGVNIASAYFTSDTATAGMSGTSMASPHVAGVAALYMEQVGNKTPSEVRNAIVAAGTAGVVVSPGTGSPNLLLYSRFVAIPAVTATFMGTDTTTQGNWKGTYGAQAYVLVNDATTWPTLTVSGQGSWTWQASTSDVRGLQKGVAAGRIAATWFNFGGSAFTIDANTGDAQEHRIGVYVVDWDGGGTRSETLEMLDPSTGTVLDTRTVTSFTGGQFWMWRVNGSVRIRVTSTGSINAVVSGVFLDPAIAPPPNQAPTVSITAPIEGASFGAPAAIAISANASDPDVGGSVASVAFYGDGVFISADATAPYTATWNVATAGPHTVSAIATDDKAAPSLPSVVNVVVTPGAAPTVTFAGTDTATQGNWKNVYGTQGYMLVNDTTSLPAGASVTPTGALAYTWAASTSDVRALQKGVAAGRIAATWYGATTFSINVTAGDTLEHQVGVYVVDWDGLGARGEMLEMLDPSNGTVLDTRMVTSFTGGQYWMWRVTGTVRIRVTRTGGSNAVVSAVFLDPAIALPPNQAPTVSITTPIEGASFGAPAAIAISANASDPDVGGSVASVAFYGDGVFISADATAPYTATWNVATVGPHTVSAIATDDRGAPSPPSVVNVVVTPGAAPTVTFAGTDTATQGNWKNVYGTQGYMLVNDTTSLPAGASVTAPGAGAFTWAASTSDVRALQKGVAAGRIAATWFGPTFPINVNAGDALEHRIGVYVVDWDGGGARSETLEMLDPATGTVLDTRTVTSFTGGQYWIWRVTGAVRIRVTRTGGANAVVSGVFLDP